MSDQPRPEKVTPEIQQALPQRAPNGLHAALGFFSAIPVPAFGVVDRRVARHTVLVFWLQGVILGALAAIPALAVKFLGGDGLLSAVVYVSALAMLTRGTHLDGLADTADGLGSGKPAAEALEIMRKPDMGALGALTLFLTILLQASALSNVCNIAALIFAFIAGPALGRLTIIGATQPHIPMARERGFGALFGKATRRWEVYLSYGLALACCASMGWLLASWGKLSIICWTNVFWAAAAAGAALLWATVARNKLVKRFTGMTGDTFGTLIETTQTVFWLMWALGW